MLLKCYYHEKCVISPKIMALFGSNNGYKLTMNMIITIQNRRSEQSFLYATCSRNSCT